MESKTLKDVLPADFNSFKYDDTRAYSMRDVIVTKENCSMIDDDEYQAWPGKHKNIYFWVELENGNIVGWNENPSRGWSFPVMKNPKRME